MRIEGKVAIVTGASRGIGKAIALALAREGASVVVAARSETEGHLPGTIHRTVEEIHTLGGRALAIRTDVTSEEDIDAMVRKTVDHFGRVDILVNNAGVYIPQPLVEVSTKKWDLVMSVNLRGTFLCTRAVLPGMVKQSGGCIINLSSVLGTRVIGGGVAYGVTKAAIERFTQGLAREVRQHSIAVNALCPGVTDTEGARMQSPGADRSSFQRPEMWSMYALFVARQGISLTGQCLTAEDLEKLVPETGRAD